MQDTQLLLGNGETEPKSLLMMSAGMKVSFNLALESYTSIFSQVHMRTSSGGSGPRSNSGGKSNGGGGGSGKRKKVMQMVKGEEKKRLTPLFKRKRESIV